MKPRVLILGKRGGILQWYEHLLDTQPQLADFDIRGFALNHNSLSERATKTLARALGKSTRQEMTTRNLAAVMAEFRPDVLVIADLFYLSESMIELLNSFKPETRLVHWIGDFFDHRLLRTGALIDDFYFTDSGLVADAKRLGLASSHYLPLAYNPVLFSPPTDSARVNDLLFIGAWSPNREKIIRQIELPMTVMGKGWERIKDTPHKVSAKKIPIAEVARLYQTHACVLNIINSNNISCGVNMRCFEAPACGALLITDAVADLPLCFEDHEVASYNSVAELVALQRTLMAQDTEKKAIAAAGTARVETNHSYAHRLQVIVAAALPPR